MLDHLCSCRSEHQIGETRQNAMNAMNKDAQQEISSQSLRFQDSPCLGLEY